MSRAIRPRQHGGPEVLAVVDVPTPRPGAGEVVVRVRAAGVNPIDWKLYGGDFHEVDDDQRDEAGLTEEMPTLGLECAGVVVEVGAEVRDVIVGEEVLVYPVTAAYADHVVAPPSSLVRRPAALGEEEAAGLMLAGTTAAHALHAVGAGAGDTVLVHGGSGGVGLMAVQLARIAGATVVATASERNHGVLRDLGAIPVAHGEGSADRIRAAAPHGIDAAVDTVGTDEALDVSVALVADRGRIASITGSDRRAEAGIRLLGYGPGQDAGTGYRASVRQALVDHAGAGRLRVLIAGTFALADAADAHRFARRSHAPGKVVLLP
ncbi:NADP-dependent oxidoreductase [Clavibacter michiganensis]|uniref:NADP-dependent oxidoreductase n=1 Tax=Clavibacter michiganensis TaxID=28447 RepID=UPI001365759A|nr:NADP-dependent oxidoreductase [Clavibacter michiganensis]MDO4018949.1 NADP-dependent oxidoreductase [Clavibacter michiganensis]MDO4038740.1 NADP-dependent oxidoreductase [Clavibacter michiganensis]MDO4042112.1 NADP-dependent oxidoreductase [Clavibacter michiganensis]MDO4051204.1 NADP-dependent oxidoreductase [Clavibacter michiganensis]MDO4060748.1 NADP-dependent oxidoreductase [Clavibacter michiganensis]